LLTSYQQMSRPSHEHPDTSQCRLVGLYTAEAYARIAAMRVPTSPSQFYRDMQILLRPTVRTVIKQSFSTSRPALANRILDPIRIPPTFHDCLRVCSANNVLLLAFFTTSACTPCRTITPLLQDLITTRSPKPDDKFSALSFAEVELDSPDQSNGSMMDLGIEYGITSLPTLAGFGGRRTERLTDRIIDTKMMSDKSRIAAWIDEEMKKGDPFGTGSGGGLFARIFGSG
jgi:thiol-disulfide isomerase/thioredoxin